MMVKDQIVMAKPVKIITKRENSVARKAPAQRQHSFY